ncbi:MAG: formate--tetrahydrofolate ligase [Methylobacterium sp.]|nr:formate--tetrahydrofolate ligase [Methylobacterium sp.]MCA3661015.1 formate--tetrahydrofolate ligase [Methylobacterium sp.]MCA3662947.1 formate--tetrahydrofolate ligase [Methylobacterium sp.]MCA3670131.1 formate--tetrahydrofolate ligase [Methylobacterium sp.]MCA3673156.1 formate--tetrahydrofolate ligase [Methylobacterium sp.]
MPSDIEIARAARLLPIGAIAEKLGIPDEALSPYGKHVAKVDLDWLKTNRRKPGKLVLVTAINPTPAGEGKTTTTVGLGDALNRIGKKTVIALREPSLGPCFGVKGGAAGGGHAQIVPMEQINLHFTGDFHAISAAHNLLSAMLDNHIYWGNALGIDTRRITWRRAIDMNDRSLRGLVSSLGGVSNGFPREDGFDITVASEVMAAFCLAESLADLEARLARIIVAETRDRKPVTAADLKAHGAMTVLLKDALQPNLVQTLEGSPAFVHGGPFANIAHGCNSLIATKTALSLGDFVVTEAGFGADLGAEKFLDIKCRMGGLAPSAIVIVATLRALKMHGGVAKAELGQPNVSALRAGFVNLARHIGNMRKFGLEPLVAINHFSADSAEEEAELIRLVKEEARAEAFLCRHWAEGGKGAEALARRVAEIAESGSARFQPLYPDSLPLAEKMRTIAREIYGAADIAIAPDAAARIARFTEMGFGHLPVCVAKTQVSFSADPKLLGAPSGHVVPVRDAMLSAGAGFVVMICGDILRMPGLPREPAAERIHLTADGVVEGLF